MRKEIDSALKKALFLLKKIIKSVILSLMKKRFKNEYFLLRHGKNIHQTSKKDIVYGYPDDNPPCELIDEGIREAESAGFALLESAIDLIISSDVLRTRQTAEIVSGIIGYSDLIVFDERLRDKNWGVFAGKKKEEVWDFYDNQKIRAFDVAPERGETWDDCRKRVCDFFNDIESVYNNRNILIVSHSNPLWLLEGMVSNLSNQELLDNYGKIIKTGEVRKL